MPGDGWNELLWNRNHIKVNTPIGPPCRTCAFCLQVNKQKCTHTASCLSTPPLSAALVTRRCRELSLQVPVGPLWLGGHLFSGNKLSLHSSFLLSLSLFLVPLFPPLYAHSANKTHFFFLSLISRFVSVPACHPPSSAPNRCKDIKRHRQTHKCGMRARIAPGPKHRLKHCEFRETETWWNITVWTLNPD